MRVFVAEDEKDLNQLIVQKLKSSGYSVDAALDGDEALDILSYTEYDIIVLDIMMPGKDGIEILGSLRAKGNETPVIFLTAKDSIEDRVLGLDSGANDYLTKPFSFDELLARIRVMTRVSYGKSENIIRVSDLEMNCTSKEVKRGDKVISLSAKEYALLEYMLMNQGNVLSREQIENHIWNYDYEGGTNLVDVYMSYLRKKIDGISNVKLIHTLRGRGYVLKEME